MRAYFKKAALMIMLMLMLLGSGVLRQSNMCDVGLAHARGIFSDAGELVPQQQAEAGMPSATVTSYQRLDAAHFVSYMKQLLREEVLPRQPYTEELADPALESFVELATSTRQRLRAKTSTTAQTGDPEKCRNLLNTWIAKCVFAV